MSKIYPIAQPAMLNNTIQTNTTVKLINGMQVAEVVFLTAAGDMGTVTLSPESTRKENVVLTQSTQRLIIESVEFQPAFGGTHGSVIAKGWATDTDGSGYDPFNRQIANWSDS